MNRHCLLAFGILTLAPVSLRAADEPALRERIVALARTVALEDFAYTRTVETEQIGGKNPMKKVLVERFDPAQPEGQRWNLISIDDKKPTANEAQDYAKGLPKRRPAHYGRVASYFAAGSVTSTPDSSGKILYHFTSLPKETVVVAETDLSAGAAGEGIANPSAPIPFLEEVRFRSTKSARIKLIAKIDRFETVTRYRLMPNGKPALSELTSEMSGSMLGQTGSIRTRIVYSDQRPAR